MSPARARRSARRGRGRGGPRFRRLVDAWRAERQQRTPMPHGTRVASIEADLGADMTPGRQARWERLEIDRDDPGMALEDAWFRSALGDVVPADTPDRAARIEAAVDLARERFLAHGEITWPEQALDLLDQQPHPQQHQEQDQEEAMHGEQDSDMIEQPSQPDPPDLAGWPEWTQADLERADTEIDAAEERDEAARRERVASLTAAMGTERALSIVSDPSLHDERYGEIEDYDQLEAARAVCEREGIDHRAMTNTIERYLDGFELDDAYSDQARADIRRAGEPRTHDERGPVDHETDHEAEHDQGEPVDEEPEP